MDTTRLKSFAPEARRQLLEQVERKLDFVLTERTPDLAAQEQLVEMLRRAVQVEGRGPLIERVAYTWFNRFAAFRYLDAKGWHPFRARVLTPATPEETQPELLRQVRGGALPDELREWCDVQRIDNLLAGRIPSANPQAEVQRLLIISVCQFYAGLLPDVFERVDDFTRLLLPDDLLTERSVPHAFQTEITDADCVEVEVLGWLYQFYISEKKDAVMARKKAVPSEDIPAVTQLFTPHWIVRYLVENSLGRLWLLNRPSSKLREYMSYYIEGEPECDYLKLSKPEEIRLLDPAVGSGHMLTYAFDLLYMIYEEEGYPITEIPSLILRHNLHGLEICPRAAQLAEIALIFKAREKSRRFFQPEKLVQPNILALSDVRFEKDELRSYMTQLALDDLLTEPMLKLFHQFEEAETLGALIQPCLNEHQITIAHDRIMNADPRGQLFLRETQTKLLRVLEEAKMLCQRYHIVVANPPYLGGKQMTPAVKEFAKEQYEASKADLFGMFIERGFTLVSAGGFSAMVTMESWMFLASFETLRSKILGMSTILSMVHMPYLGKGGTSMGINFGTCATVWGARPHPTYSGIFQCVRYYECDESGVPLQFPMRNERMNRSSRDDFKRIPGSPIAYWMSSREIAAFSQPKIADSAQTRVGCQTSDNTRFLRLWYECSAESSDFTCQDRQHAQSSQKTWFPYNKGGDFRRWYGNGAYVVNWRKDGEDMFAFARQLYGSPTRTVKNAAFYFRESITWSKVSSGAPSFRYQPPGAIFDVAGASLFFNAKQEGHLLLGFLNSAVATKLLGALSPTLNFETTQIGALPLMKLPAECAKSVSEFVPRLIEISKRDWDDAETSWDFRDLPLLRLATKGVVLSSTWQVWSESRIAAIRQMQELETESNRLFIEAYGLTEELKPEVPEEQITLARPDKRRDMAALLSYAVGCMMGRYSLDRPGLILANSGDTLAEYLSKVGRLKEQLTFLPDEDGIVPMLDGDWFEDDVVCRVREFLRVTFGPQPLEQNIAFLEDALGKDLRKYFLTDFYKDHLQTYKKRPIYWLFQSPQKHFRALIYLHRYTRDTVNTLLNGYLREFQHKLNARIGDLQRVLESESVPSREKTRAQKELDKCQRARIDVEIYERDILLPLAQKRLEIDLDDGVKTNYPKFGAALAPIPGLSADED